MGDSTPFIEFMLEVILKTLRNLKKENVPKNVPKNRLEKILTLMHKNKNITIIELSTLLSVTEKTIKRDISKLKEQNRVTREGSLKTGHWEVIDRA